jgi:hypothetical protein
MPGDTGATPVMPGGGGARRPGRGGGPDPVPGLPYVTYLTVTRPSTHCGADSACPPVQQARIPVDVRVPGL